ncbi:MAG: tRNA (adenosine(37)-N6)-threonylcarbamoyltransferase complex ATPase subunit type 1 TsaE [Nitrospirae bacterium]|nr:tRNA (adenosine(37)-N6)-threonylcarbamoyltransferase complex ATPase subunit type 1 TsaE [Nitrospirota bacterium]MBF0535960.1 tRNA (adenosine(37)-N6)-threonylcarbamoyltransferase complex ATPase subunit type 1 TsaE [Nitrospirota bacterium]MBF0618064.1 tRNA (adenosine(37)-N6)-threonylcarbamoyltransferase complex ATPase subunit type 1 TsaE [Nitrospirota bacterium]
MRLRSSSDWDTKCIGHKLGKLLSPGDTVFLTGGLGSGKTTLVKGIAGAFGINETDITSASFTIIAEHEGTVPLYHIDLYRLDNLSAIDDIGLYEYIGADGIAVIEWADKLQGTETATVTVDLEYISENEREITIEGVDEQSWNNL